MSGCSSYNLSGSFWFLNIYPTHYKSWGLHSPKSKVYVWTQTLGKLGVDEEIKENVYAFIVLHFELSEIYILENNKVLFSVTPCSIKMLKTTLTLLKFHIITSEIQFYVD